MSDTELLKAIRRMVEDALREAEWKNRKETVDAIKRACDKMLTRPENVAEWGRTEKAMRGE